MAFKEGSVIISTYKRHEDVIETLASLNRQTPLPDEVILMNHCVMSLVKSR